MSHIPKETKEQILKRIKEGESVNTVSQEYGISPKTIYYWLRIQAEGPITMADHRKVTRENQQLKEIIGALTIEMAKLKKKGSH